MNLYSNVANQHILKTTIDSIDDVIQLPKDNIYALNHCPPTMQDTVLFNVMDEWLRILLLDSPPTVWHPFRLKNVGEVINALLKKITLNENGVPKINLNNIVSGMNVFVNWKAMHNLFNAIKIYNECKRSINVNETYFFFNLSLLTCQMIYIINQIRPILDKKAVSENAKALCNHLLDFFQQVIVLSTQKNNAENQSTPSTDSQAENLFDQYLKENTELTKIGRDLIQQSNIIEGDIDEYLAELKKVFLENIYPPLYRAWQDFRQNQTMDIGSLQSLIRHGLTIYHNKFCQGKHWSFIIKYCNDNHVLIINDDGILDKMSHKPSTEIMHVADHSATLSTHDETTLVILAALLFL